MDPFGVVGTMLHWRGGGDEGDPLGVTRTVFPQTGEAKEVDPRVAGVAALGPRFTCIETGPWWPRERRARGIELDPL